jgi:hypothetical protein
MGYEQWLEDYSKSIEYSKTGWSIMVKRAWEGAVNRPCTWQYYNHGYTTMDITYRVNCVNIIFTGNPVGKYCPYCGGKISLI